MTPEEARQEFFELLDEIQAMAPGDWVNEDVPAVATATIREPEARCPCRGKFRYETMTTKRRHYWCALPAAAIILLTLAGCGTTPSTNPPTSTAEQTMDPEQARKEYFDLFTQIQALAPGDWGVVIPPRHQRRCLPAPGQV